MNSCEPEKDLDDIAHYYSGKLAAHGENALGVDWNGGESQQLRFVQLCKVVDPSDGASLNDLGCGYGALREHLDAEHLHLDYLGVDISEPMILAANKRLQGHPATRFLHASIPDRVADFGVASGIFNVRLNRTDAEWRHYVEDTLVQLDATSRRGFAFNCLTSYSDPARMRDYLFYADPCQLFDLCKKRFARNVALMHDYGLFEFTILVRKQS